MSHSRTCLHKAAALPTRALSPRESSGVPLHTPQLCHEQDVETGCISLGSGGHGLTWVSKRTRGPHQQFSLTLVCSQGRLITNRRACGLLELTFTNEKESPGPSHRSPRDYRPQPLPSGGFHKRMKPEPLSSSPGAGDELTEEEVPLQKELLKFLTHFRISF